MAPSLAVRSLAIFFRFPTFLAFVSSGPTPGLSGLSAPSTPRARSPSYPSWFSRVATSEAAAAALESIVSIAVSVSVSVSSPVSGVSMSAHPPSSRRSLLTPRTKLWVIIILDGVIIANYGLHPRFGFGYPLPLLVRHRGEQRGTYLPARLRE